MNYTLRKMRTKNEVWEALDWNKSNSILAEELNLSQEAVRLQRKKRNKPEPLEFKPGRTIFDEFTNLHVSRQRKYQLRKQQEGKCIICGEDVVTKYHCEYHRNQVNTRMNQKNKELSELISA
jgi:hypothetical protein